MPWRISTLALAAVVFGLLAAACGSGDQFGPPVLKKSEAELRELGRTIYAQYCATCHGDGEGAAPQPGVPSQGPQGHTWHHADAQLREIVWNGGPTGAPVTMPGFSKLLSREEVEAVLIYIKAGWTPEQRAIQEGISIR